MRGLADEIAVLEGIDPLDGRIGQTPASAQLYGRNVFAPVMEGLGMMDDGRIGQRSATGDEYAKVTGPFNLFKRGAIDASSGGNYSGGSSWTPGLPLTPSNAGLADADLVAYSQSQSLPVKRNVIDASGGANYSGGSSWTPGLPLTPSNAGLAASLIAGGYGGAGLGTSLIAGGYGGAGMGRVDQYSDFAASLIAGGYGSAGMGRVDQYSDFAGTDLNTDTAYGSTMEIEDGRIGQRSATGDEYAQVTGPFNLVKRNMIQASGGANYSGGSSWTPGMPTTPSSIGLAGFDPIDGLSDAAISTLGKRVGATPDFKRAVGSDQMKKLTKALVLTMQDYYRAGSPAVAATQLAKGRVLVNEIQKLRGARKRLVAVAKAA